MPQFDHRQVRSVIVSSSALVASCMESDETLKLHTEQMSPMRVRKVSSDILAKLVEKEERHHGKY